LVLNEVKNLGDEVSVVSNEMRNLRNEIPVVLNEAKNLGKTKFPPFSVLKNL
jgi:hypothetical protein